MSVGAWFTASLLLTVLLLGGTLITGLEALRKRHLTLVALTVLSLALTIYWAEQLGRLYDLDAAGRIKPVHLALAKIATLSYLLPIGTGLATLKRPATRRLHRKAAFLAVGLTLAAFATGTWMMLAAEPL